MSKAKATLSTIFISQLYGSSLCHWLLLLKRFGPPDPGRHLLKAAMTTLGICVFTPLLLVEKCSVWLAAAGSKRTNSAPERQMVFVVGFYRSGTTHVHRVLACDPNNAFLDTVFCFFPNFAIAGGRALRYLFSWLLPADRGSDRIKLAVRFPEEDEYALCNSSRYGLYHATFFPKNWFRVYENNMFDENRDPAGASRWLEDYQRVLNRGLRYFEKTNARTCTRLVVKNPANMTRVKAMLRAYPHARFVFVKRSPYALFPSLLNYYRKEIDMFGYQNISDAVIEQNVLHWYKAYTRSFLETRKLIGSQNLFELKFEDFERDPLRELEKMYSHFGFDNFADCKHPATQYLAGVSGYRKNDFKLSPRDAEVVEEAWRFAFDEMGYQRVAAGQI